MSGDTLKATKKRRKTRESSIAPSDKKRRSDGDCHSATRLQIGSLLGLDTAKYCYRIEKEIFDLKLDALENFLTETDESFFFSIAGRKVSWCPSHTSQKLLFSYQNYFDSITFVSYLNPTVPYHRTLSSDLPEMPVLSGRLSSHTKHCLKLGNAPLATNGESRL